jgi:hypothetical protein
MTLLSPDAPTAASTAPPVVAALRGMWTDRSLGCLHLFKLSNEFSTIRFEMGIDV